MNYNCQHVYIIFRHPINIHVDMSDETVHHEEKTTCAVRHAIHDVLQVWGQSQNHSLEVGILKTKAARQRTENNCKIPILQSLSAPLIKIVHITILVGMPWILYEFVVITSQDSKLTSTRRHFFLTKEQSFRRIQLSASMSLVGRHCLFFT